MQQLLRVARLGRAIDEEGREGDAGGRVGVVFPLDPKRGHAAAALKLGGGDLHLTFVLCHLVGRRGPQRGAGLGQHQHARCCAHRCGAGHAQPDRAEGHGLRARAARAARAARSMDPRGGGLRRCVRGSEREHRARTGLNPRTERALAQTPVGLKGPGGGIGRGGRPRGHADDEHQGDAPEATAPTAGAPWLGAQHGSRLLSESPVFGQWRRSQCVQGQARASPGARGRFDRASPSV